MLIFSRNHKLKRTRLPPSFMLMHNRFVRCHFISHHGQNSRESSNQLRQHISHINLCFSCFIIWSKVALYWYTDNPSFLQIFCIFNIIPASLPTRTAFLCLSHHPGCTMIYIKWFSSYNTNNTLWCDLYFRCHFLLHMQVDMVAICFRIQETGFLSS